jgi:putative ABC transport system substrate-binding protein
VDGMLADQRARIADLAAKSRLPAVYGLSDHAEAGGLMAYGPSVSDRFRRAATYVTRFSRGPIPPTFRSSNPQSPRSSST